MKKKVIKYIDDHKRIKSIDLMSGNFIPWWNEEDGCFFTKLVIMRENMCFVYNYDAKHIADYTDSQVIHEGNNIRLSDPTEIILFMMKANDFIKELVKENNN